jgi:predicted nucleic acid-binding Zn ribbon protein
VPTWRPPWRKGIRARVVEDPVAPGAGAPHRIGSVLEGLLESGPWPGGLALGELARRWHEVVGEPLDRQTAPSRLEAGVLSVRAATSAWAAQVRFLAPQVAANANEVLGRDAVRDVRIFVEHPAQPGSERG